MSSPLSGSGKGGEGSPRAKVAGKKSALHRSAGGGRCAASCAIRLGGLQKREVGSVALSVPYLVDLWVT